MYVDYFYRCMDDVDADLCLQLTSARKDTVLPLSTPIRGNDGSTISEIIVPKDTNIMIGIHAVNTSPEIWGPDAAEWKPERWLSPLPESVTNARIPGVYSNMFDSSLNRLLVTNLN